MQTYHQFSSTDMPRFRRLRTRFLQSFKMQDKLSRADKIASAILSDVDWNKLGIDNDTSEVICGTISSMDDLDETITESQAHTWQ